MELKLLIVMNGWSGKNIGGGDYHMLRVMKEWSNSHSVSLVTTLFGLLFCKPLLSDKYKIYLSSSGTKAIDSFRLIPAYFKRIVRSVFLHFDDKPDMIVCSSHLLFDTLPGLILHFRFRAKLIVYVHHIIAKHTDHRRGILSKISILTEKLSLPLVRSANIVFVVNEDVRAELIKMGFEPGKVLLSSNGVDYNAIDSIRPIGDLTFDGCFCGRLVKRKGIYDLIDIWKLVILRYPNSKLVIIGDGPEYSNLSNILKESNLEENILLMGFVSEHDKYLTMKQSRIFVFPSYEEGWGIAVAEAIACRLDVVLYDLGAYKAFEEHIIMVEKANTTQMAEIIVELIEKPMSKNANDRKLMKSRSVLDWKDVSNMELQAINDLMLTRI
jgi:glycosyltransferase involved in cell wall biosynthesis